MNISMKSIELIKERLDISYKLAEKLLIKSNGDIDKAELLYKIRQESIIKRTFDLIAGFFRFIIKGIDNLFAYRLVITKNKTNLINIKLWIAVFILIICFSQVASEFLLIGFIIMMILIFANCELIITTQFNKKSNIKNVQADCETSGLIEKDIEVEEDYVVEQQEGYSEITIE